MTSTPIQPTQQSPAAPDLRALNVAQAQETSKLINCARPGIIQSFSPGGNGVAPTATVQIAQQNITSISPTGVKTFQPFAPLLNVPVIFPQGGGFILTFPVTEGDECLVVFNDREIDNWFQSGGTNSVPTTLRLHDMADAVCYVGMRSNPRGIANISTTTTQLRSVDGTTHVEVAGGGIVNIVAPTSINFTAPTVNINASSAVNVITPVETITGVLDVQNVSSSSTPCVINGNITTNADVIASGISLVSHKHTGVTTGGGDTGGPI